MYLDILRFKNYFKNCEKINRKRNEGVIKNLAKDLLYKY